MPDRSLKTSPQIEDPPRPDAVKKAAFEHESVMAVEVVALLARAPAGVVVDCTAGGGGHSAAILQSRSDITVLALDQDPDAVGAASRKLDSFGDRARIVQTRFSAIDDVLKANGVAHAAAILADLGVSSHHFDTAERGFSFGHDGPLDMRMNPDAGYSLSDRLASISERDLADILYAYGDVRASRRAAAAVLGAWRDGVNSTTELARRVAAKLPRGGKTHPATRVFQALRMWVNDEAGELDKLLKVGPHQLMDDGVMVVISFHSGEDRQVKRRFRELCRGRDAGYSLLTRKPVMATDDEVRRNPRSRSARLRGLTKGVPSAQPDKGESDITDGHTSKRKRRRRARVSAQQARDKDE